MLRSKLPNEGTTIFSVMTALALEHDAINLAQGFPDYAAAPDLIDLVRHAMVSGHNQYAPMAGLPALRRAIAQKYAVAHDIRLDADTEITISPGATAALYTAIAAVVQPGDEVIIFDPAYDSYAPAITVNGGIVRRALLRAPEYQPDWDEVRSLVSDRTTMIIVNTPHNPTGTMWGDDDLDALAQIVGDGPIVVLSDEVYELITFDGRRHRSVLDVPALRDRSFVVTSFGKTFHTTGWKIGCCVASPLLTQEFRKVHQFLSFSVHTPSQVALATYMSDPAVYLGLSTFFTAKRDRFRAALEGTPWTVRPCEGTYFQLLGYEAISDEDDVAFARRLTIDHGVAAIPISPFIGGSRGSTDRVVRFCFAKEDATLDAAAERLSGV
ncbi:MAG: aminotransferase class I/II-fold pyridoxal phosphate-dependent enzyme [Candidatus Kapabacteria bacterium]|nr:aminotransferase class I/II-fold pyridoxal phosphate-dependent enzyme [Candidatus Kapabacteria bacterium]